MPRFRHALTRAWFGTLWPRRGGRRARRADAAVTLAGLLILSAGTAALAAAAPSVAAPHSAVTRWWHPPARPTFYWQLQGTLPLHEPALIDDVDGFDTSAAEVARLHAAGHRVICYIDVGTWERWRPDARDFPRAVLGHPNGWPGERWLDIRNLRVLEPIMRRRLEMCAQKGFDGVEPDNINPIGNDPGFPITPRDVIRYARWVAGTAHSLGLAVLQKNGSQFTAALEPSFDGALTEQCNQYSECAAYEPYLRVGKPVIDAEYQSRLFPRFCTTDARLGIVGALYNLALNGRRYRPCPPLTGPTATVPTAVARARMA
ncbi:endo alpha-1,4 polygalactosaminidase [Conexibacter sp. DBS9H8]|uniref:endo alpha-1,4 polygalactosaminidase n=1 Tax=Conexibacter sp. DBS9H8 TaxID=2937801 RepID=UPI00200FEF42|nr:endo alpha-1,4 polygalactosaminidase [Conexibacter sp. DBS9H8]